MIEARRALEGSEGMVNVLCGLVIREIVNIMCTGCFGFLVRVAPLSRAAGATFTSVLGSRYGHVQV
jgi:hypothetical protein